MVKVVWVWLREVVSDCIHCRKIVISCQLVISH